LEGLAVFLGHVVELLFHLVVIVGLFLVFLGLFLVLLLDGLGAGLVRRR